MTERIPHNKPRCDNCGWWKPISTQLGTCTHPTVDDRTWCSHQCNRHTGMFVMAPAKL